MSAWISLHHPKIVHCHSRGGSYATLSLYSEGGTSFNVFLSESELEAVRSAVFNFTPLKDLPDANAPLPTRD